MRIDDVPVKGAVNPHITYSQTYGQMDALIAAGATIDELEKWFFGGYSRMFLIFIQAWHKYRGLIRSHAEAAAVEAARKKSKKGKF